MNYLAVVASVFGLGVCVPLGWLLWSAPSGFTASYHGR